MSDASIMTNRRAKPDAPGPEPLTPLSMAILLALAEGDLHGYALLQEIERQTEGSLSPGTGTLYAALQRLAEGGMIIESPDLPAPDEDQRRRYYRITSAGRATAAAESRRMERVLRIARKRLATEGGA
jgi:DNA-binding PadR family transcriptional regulator